MTKSKFSLKKKFYKKTEKNKRKTTNKINKRKTTNKINKRKIKKNKTIKKKGGSLNLDKLPVRYYYPLNDEINNPNTPLSITNERLTTSNKIV